MKPKSVAPQSLVMAVDRKLHNTWVYIKRHWQLYLLFLMPAVLLTYSATFPMGGVLIAFQKYNPFKGIWDKQMGQVQELLRGFLSSPDFMRYLMQHPAKLSVISLLWGFPIPILLAFLLSNRIKSNKIKRKGTACPAYAQLYFRDRAVRYRARSAVCHRSCGNGLFPCRHQLYDIAGGFP